MKTAAYVVMNSGLNVVGELVQEDEQKVTLKNPLSVMGNMLVNFVHMGDIPAKDETYDFPKGFIVKVFKSELVDKFYTTQWMQYKAQLSGLAIPKHNS